MMIPNVYANPSPLVAFDLSSPMSQAGMNGAIGWWNWQSAPLAHFILEESEDGTGAILLEESKGGSGYLGVFDHPRAM